MTTSSRLDLVAAGLAAAVLLSAPLHAVASDIAWRAERTNAWHDGAKRISQGTALFTNGDRASTRSVCEDGAGDQPGWGAMNCEVEYRFADGARIFMRTVSRWNQQTLEATGSGTFTGGTQRFEGITGTATAAGLSGRIDWKGSYEVPAGKQEAEAAGKK